MQISLFVLGGSFLCHHHCPALAVLEESQAGNFPIFVVEKCQIARAIDGYLQIIYTRTQRVASLPPCP
jgi:hypothetical protein